MNPTNSDTDSNIEDESDLPEDEAEEENDQEELEDLLKRQKAEFENYRKRVLEERKNLVETANRDLILELLPVIDNFEKAINVEVNDKKLESYLEGFRFLYKQLHDLLEQSGVEKSVELGDDFDPEKAQAINIEMGDSEEDKVVEIYQNGYLLADKVIRLAKVKVLKSANEAKEESTMEEETNNPS